MDKVIITCFAGRKEYLQIQSKYIIKILELYDFVESYDIWDFAWSEEDSLFLLELSKEHPKINIKYSPNYGIAERGGEVASKQFAYFFSQAYDYDTYKDHTFIKIDDDVLYVDFLNFQHLIHTRQQYPEYFLVSANVINSDLSIIDPTAIHLDFLNNFKDPNLEEVHSSVTGIEYSNRFRLSINFCSWLGRDIPHIVSEFSNGIGADDEWRLCHVIPLKLNRNNLILKDYKVAHFSFGTQNFNKNLIRTKYQNLCNTII